MVGGTSAQHDWECGGQSCLLVQSVKVLLSFSFSFFFLRGFHGPNKNA